MMTSEQQQMQGPSVVECCGLSLLCGALRALPADLTAVDIERHCNVYGIGL